MSILLLRLAGPMQSWGTRSRFGVRDTSREPSKSGVIGLLSAALGRPRTASVADLTALTMAVRVDREGRVMADYQTAGGEARVGSTLGLWTEGRNKGKPRPYGVAKADGSTPDTVVSNRYYLADASFLVGLDGPRPLLEQLDAAVRRPVWPLFLGRKAFVPGAPIHPPAGGPSILEGDLMNVLQRVPLDWEPRYGDCEVPEAVRYVVDTDYGAGEPRQDVPLSFADRRFGVRHVRVGYLPDPSLGLSLPPIPCPGDARVPESAGPQPA